jgi:glycosyltransferase involved in cell wall biosynthesis
VKARSTSDQHRQPRVIFLNRYFHPDHSATSQMLSDLAFGLTQRGLKVSVITGRQRYNAPQVQLPRQEVINGVGVYRVWTSRFGRSHLLGRSVDYLTFYVAAALTLWRHARCDDVIVAKTDPPLLSVFVAPIARWRRARLVNWLQDLFPEVADALNIGGGPARAAYPPLRWLRNRSLRRGHMNVVVGDRMTDTLIRLGVSPSRIRAIPNWASGDLIRPIENSANVLRRDWGLSRAFTVGYSGNLGRAHETKTILTAMAATRCHQAAGNQAAPEMDRSNIRWLFIGDGILLDPLRAEVARLKLDNVIFKPYQPRERLAESLSAIDLHLISLRPELEGLIVPSKFYGIAAAGRPIIFIGDPDGEIGRLISKHGCGRTVKVGDGAQLAQLIREFAANPSLCRKMGERARRAFEAEFDKPIAVAKWEELLREVVGSPASLSMPEKLPLRDRPARPARGVRR